MHQSSSSSSSVPQELVAGEGPGRVVADGAGDGVAHRHRQYPEVHVRVVEARLEEDRHPVSHDPEQTSVHLCAQSILMIISSKLSDIPSDKTCWLEK